MKNDIGSSTETMPHYTTIPDNTLWTQLIAHQGEPFTTSGRGSRPGIPFTYTIRGGEMFVSNKQRSITKATVMLAYENALRLQQKDGCVRGPKCIGVFGASYLYSIFLQLGVIRKADDTPAVSIESTEGSRERDSCGVDIAQALCGVALGKDVDDPDGV